MKKISIGILAHVDAGKTTLTESILYRSGVIKTPGRVDNGDAYLDTESLEKKRGVTIYSKQAVVDLGADHPLNISDEDVRITIIDTPGHVDFIGEAERSMSVLDLAVLMISAPDGVTDSVKRLKMMLESYKVPYVIFINKMDMYVQGASAITSQITSDFDQGIILLNDKGFPNGVSAECAGTLKKSGSDNACMNASDIIRDDILEDIASLSESTIEKYLEEGAISIDDISELLYSGRFHPVICGSALSHDGTEDLVRMITAFLPHKDYSVDFGAKVFKLIYEDGHKISFMKITGGQVSVRDILPDERLDGEKVTGLRLYSGGKYTTMEQAEAGDVIAVLGPENTFVGMGIGIESDEKDLISRPVLRYELLLPDDIPARTFVPKIKEIEASDPLLKLEFQSESSDSRGKNKARELPASYLPSGIFISVMGEFQLEILTSTIEERYGIKVLFDRGDIIYKETIAYPVVGYGHFEPLRHYAEAHILMEPLPAGSGIEVASALSVNDLSINWQKTVLSTIINELPTGVLTGSELTDIKFTLIAGKSHTKHTESRDFAESTRRAIRQGLMKAGCVLLEPCYEYRMTVPSGSLGRAMNDIGMMNGTSAIDSSDTETAVISGKAPARNIFNYQSELTKYTSGKGRITLNFAGYEPCDEEYADTVTEATDYDPDNDVKNPTGSVFCSHGAGYYVPWYECESMMHVESREDEFLYGYVESEEEKAEREADLVIRAAKENAAKGSLSNRLYSMGTDEIDKILRDSTHSNASSKKGSTKRVYHQKKVISAQDVKRPAYKPQAQKPKYLLVDGYNIIYAWDELKSLLTADPYGMDGAKYRLLDMLSEYKVLKDTEVIAVFDAYKVKGHVTEKMDYMGVHVVYTKTAETADQYIARFTVENSKNLDITVATSDGLVQLIITGENAKRLSARDFKDEYDRVKNEVMNAGK